MNKTVVHGRIGGHPTEGRFGRAMGRDLGGETWAAGYGRPHNSQVPKLAWPIVVIVLALSLSNGRFSGVISLARFLYLQVFKPPPHRPSLPLPLFLLNLSHTFSSSLFTSTSSHRPSHTSKSASFDTIPYLFLILLNHTSALRTLFQQFSPCSSRITSLIQHRSCGNQRLCLQGAIGRLLESIRHSGVD